MPFNKQKKLGQIFLQDRSIIRKIIRAGKISKKDLVLEIGAGKGILTQALLKTGAKVIAVEKDRELVVFLKSFFKDKQNLEIIHADIRDFLQNTGYGILNTQYKVIGNIPYYLTSHLIKLLLELEKNPQDIILMIQKEVAQRIIEQPPKMNLLAVSVQFYAKPEIICYVPKTAFQPKPKVDSAVIRLAPINTDENADKTLRKNFFKVVRAGFKQPRKLLINNLCLDLKIDKQTIQKAFKKANIPLKARAQSLSINQWTSLSLLLTKNKL